MRTRNWHALAARWSLLLSMLATAPMASCIRQVALGQTHTGQGKLYKSGNVEYDRFFQDVHALQVQATGAGEQEAAARAPLEKALDASGATPEKLSELAQERAKKASDGGPPVHVTVTGLDGKAEADPSKKVAATLSVADPASVPADHRAFVQALGESTKAEAEIVDKYGSVQAKAGQLSARAAELTASVDRDFTTQSLRREVSDELGAAKQILDATAERAREVSARARSFLLGFAEGAKGPAKTAEEPAAPAEKPAAARPKVRKGGARAVKPASEAAGARPKEEEPAPAKPAPGKPAADDFNP